MEDLLTPLKTTTTSKIKGSEYHLTEVEPAKDTYPDTNWKLDSSEAALDILSAKPDLKQLTRVLHWLDHKGAEDANFNIKIPGPKATQIINVLVNATVPDYWATLNGQQKSVHLNSQRLLLRCLSSVAGIGAITTRLRSLVTSSRDGGDRKSISEADRSEPMTDLLELLQNIIGKDTFIQSIWTDISILIPKLSKKSLLWKELISLLATGRLLSVAAEANEVLNKGSSSIRNESWIGNGKEYTSWLGRNVGALAIHLKEEDVEAWKEAARLLGKGLTLGYTGRSRSIHPSCCFVTKHFVDQIVEALYSSLIVGIASSVAKLQALLHQLHVHEQRTVLYSMIRIVSKRCLSTEKPFDLLDTSASENSTVGGLAGLLVAITQDSSALKDALVEWLTSISGGGIAHLHDTHRAVLAAITPDQGMSGGLNRVKSPIAEPFLERTASILQKSLELFGDKLYIKHTPVLHQEGNVYKISCYRED